MKNLLNKIKIFFVSFFNKNKVSPYQDKFKSQFKHDKDYYKDWYKTLNPDKYSWKYDFKNKKYTETWGELSDDDLSIDDFYRVIDNLSTSEKYFTNLKKLNEITKGWTTKIGSLNQ